MTPEVGSSVVYAETPIGNNLGPPSFDEAKVVVDKAPEIEIQLR